jgi:glycerol kinase
MRERYVAAVDQGTGSSRCLVFDRAGRIVSFAQKEHRQIHPRPGWVEQDPAEIWSNVEEVIARAFKEANLEPSDIVALGIANQRETTLVWDRHTGQPVHQAITWQDMRTDRLVRELTAANGNVNVRELTGLTLATYFAGPKLRWLLDHVPGLEARAENGDLLFGTMDSWLIWRLTGRHLTDVTNASRTLLMNLETLDWDERMLDMLGISRSMLPEIRPSAEVYGEATGTIAGIPVAAALGDQQAALFGQTCFSAGNAKCTYGTGGFMLLHTGERRVVSDSGLLTTICCRVGEETPTYALEGSIAVTGSLVQWFRDNLELIASAPEIETLARSVDDNGGCYFVPAFSGLFAPHWRSDARGVIMGLTGYINKGHLARAVLEATAWQTREVVEAMTADSGIVLGDLRVDGGMTANNLLMQFLADVLDVPVVRPNVAETVSLGAAYAAGLAVGFWSDRDELSSNWHLAAQWLPNMEHSRRERGYRKWRKAVARATDWLDDDEEWSDARDGGPLATIPLEGGVLEPGE